MVTTIPTIGFNVETVTYKNLKFQVRNFLFKYDRRKLIKFLFVLGPRFLKAGLADKAVFRIHDIFRCIRITDLDLDPEDPSIFVIGSKLQTKNKFFL